MTHEHSLLNIQSTNKTFENVQTVKLKEKRKRLITYKENNNKISQWKIASRLKLKQQSLESSSVSAYSAHTNPLITQQQSDWHEKNMDTQVLHRTDKSGKNILHTNGLPCFLQWKLHTYVTCAFRVRLHWEVAKAKVNISFHLCRHSILTAHWIS